MVVAPKTLQLGNIIMNHHSRNKPSHFVYTVREGGEGSKDYWSRIGAAFAHNDGKGFSVLLDAMPLDGKLTIRQPEDKEQR